jgi:signal transduction histidine kinase
LHAFVLQIPADNYANEARSDLWIRGPTLVIALLAVGGLGFAWRNMERMDRLQMRLMRESEMNAHLQELNVAAAGLAHETRNPLNIVRGLAQIISQNPSVPGEVRQKAGEITAEVDRVTGRLNEFITYSRAPEPRPAPTRLQSVIADVQRALDTDLQENEIACTTKGSDLVIQADESLLRQVIFNLMLNAIQAIGERGRVEISIQASGVNGAVLDIRDDGPGINPELRNEIYKPYFTTRSAGTGLGLSVVRQIVLAHHWEVEYIPGLDGGAGFRISGLKVL